MTLSSDTRLNAIVFAEDVVNLIKQRMFGMDDVIRLCLVALYADGHVLLEGNPGLGKTALVNNLGNVLSFNFGRIQFTPDLMPIDIIGTMMPAPSDNGRMRFEFEPGPIFTTLLLADEINRATPKTQSALLEVMQERRVTVSGTRHAIMPRDWVYTHQHYAGKMPFMVLATQNPIDHEGTYDLPEAQSDRFMFKVLMPMPDSETLQNIMIKVTEDATASEPLGSFFDQPEDAIDHYHRLRDAIRQVPVAPQVEEHIIRLVLATTHGVDTRNSELDRILALLEYGLGPRAAIALRFGVKAWTLFFIDERIQAANAEALAKVVIPVLRHRIKLHYEWFEQYQAKHPHVEPDRLADYYLRDLCEACLPEGREAGAYREMFKTTLNNMFEKKGF